MLSKNDTGCVSVIYYNLIIYALGNRIKLRRHTKLYKLYIYNL